MKKITVIMMAVMLSSCGIYTKYKSATDVPADLYGAGIVTDSLDNFGNWNWQKVFTDAKLQSLIEQALENNTDIQVAHLRVEETEATLKSARLSYLPSFNFAPQGSIGSFDNTNTTKTYNIPIAASWQLDIFGGLTNAKRRAQALHAQSKEYVQATRIQLIATSANLYYTLLMLDAQYAITKETMMNWGQSVRTMQAMKRAGMTTEAAVAQYEGTYHSIRISMLDLEYQIAEVQNSFCSLLGITPQYIDRSTLDKQELPAEFSVGIPVQVLANRPDVRMAEYSLMAAHYATAEARSALYPQLSLSGTLGWTNSAGVMIVNPGKLLLNAAASLVQPIFNAGANRARLKIMKAQQEESRLAFQQTLLDAGAEVNNLLRQCQTAHDKIAIRNEQLKALERAVKSTTLLMQHTPTTYLEVLTAEQSLLSARLSQIADRFDEMQGVVNLYQALGGGRNITED